MRGPPESGEKHLDKSESQGQRGRRHLYFGKSLNPLKTSNLEGLEVLDRFRGIRTLEGLEVLRDIRPGLFNLCSIETIQDINSYLPAKGPK